MRSRNRIFAVVALCVVLAVALIATLEWLGSGITVESPQRARVEVERIEPPSPLPLEPAPPNARGEPAPDNNLDELVRLAAASLSSHPEFASWLVHERLLRRFVLAVDAVAGGYSPRDEIEFLRPQRAFLVREQEGTLVITASSYRRYDAVADVVASMDMRGAAELYRRLEKRLDDVYDEVGWAGSDFDSRFREAVDHLLEVEVPDGPYEVEQRTIVYAFAQDSLEHLSDAQRQLLRMGPRNARQVQTSLRTLRQAIGWPEPTTPMVTAELEPAVAAESAPVVAAATEVKSVTDGVAMIPSPIETENLP
jgi:hypothetical protein